MKRRVFEATIPHWVLHYLWRWNWRTIGNGNYKL